MKHTSIDLLSILCDSNENLTEIRRPGCGQMILIDTNGPQIHLMEKPKRF